MGANFLKLNDDKTAALVAHPQRRPNHGVAVIRLGDANITPSPWAKNIGVVFDDVMSMEQHVTQVCKVAYWYLHNIATVRNTITLEAAAKLVVSLVLSRLDYGNAVLIGLPASVLAKLQKVQNSAARLVVRAGKRAHITPILKRLHWLPVKYRVKYKVLSLVYRGLHGLAPPYINDMLEWYTPGRAGLRSSGECRLRVPRTMGVYGNRRFSVAGPSLWNELPMDLKCAGSLSVFKCQLKTHLFRLAFD